MPTEDEVLAAMSGGEMWAAGQPSWTMLTTGTVAIPSDHFVKRVANEYSQPQQALVREFIQNSVDAGATRIDITTGDDWLTVRDNGQGILRDRMVEALLTLGGSVKSNTDSIGGYGIAKEILLFCHQSYEIRTLNSLVRGEVLQYTIETTAESFAGAEFTIRFNPAFGYDRHNFTAAAKHYVSTCLTAVEVFVNGERAPAEKRARKIDLAFPYGRVLCRRLSDGNMSGGILVRVRGLTMFSYPVRETAKEVIVELEGEVRSMLTSNRDSLRYPFRTELGKVAEAVTIDPRSFDRKKTERTLFPGRDASFYSRIETLVSQAFGGLLSDARVACLVTAVKQTLAAQQPVTALLEAAKQEATASVGYLRTGESMTALAKLDENFATDFVVSIEGTELRQAPRDMRPATMRRSYREIAKLWKCLLDEAIQSAGISLSYRIGFVLDPEKLGYFSRTDGGGADILINPIRIAEVTDKRERFMQVAILAAHELAHAAFSYHAEDFVHEEERILRKLLTRMASPSKIMREARNVVL